MDRDVAELMATYHISEEAAREALRMIKVLESALAERRMRAAQTDARLHGVA